MKKIIVWLVALCASVCGVQVVTAPASFAGVVGCTGSVQQRAVSWTEKWGYWDSVPDSPKFVEGNLTATLVYYWCPQAEKVDKVMPLNTTFCWNLTSNANSAYQFDGAKFNAYYADSNTTTNPDQIRVEDDATVQNCKTQQNSPQQWFRIDQGAFWSVSSWVVFILAPDSHIDFTSNGSTKHKYLPGSGTDVLIKVIPG